MINYATENTLTIAEAAKFARVSFVTLWRWLLTGATAPDGSKVRLRGSKLGGRWLTSREALAEFSAALTPQFEDGEAAVIRSPSKRHRASAAAAAELAKMGI
jgi:hypothetical protein